ncbi:DUF4279 domain-containing protein [Streptomyces asiaticus]
MREPGQEPLFRDGAGLWVYGYDDGFSSDPERQIEALLNDLEVRRPVLTELTREGFSLQIDVTVSVKRGGFLRVNPRLLRRICELGIPLSFTTRCPVPPDDFDWL